MQSSCVTRYCSPGDRPGFPQNNLWCLGRVGPRVVEPISQTAARKLNIIYPWFSKFVHSLFHTCVHPSPSGLLRYSPDTYTSTLSVGHSCPKPPVCCNRHFWRPQSSAKPSLQASSTILLLIQPGKGATPPPTT